MPFLHFNLRLVTLACAIALATAGCIAPITPPFTRETAKSASTTSAASPSSSAAIPPQFDQLAAPPDMASVLDKIQQVRAIDPSAEPRLLEELRRVPPSTWPLVAEQFRASLAYHEQLEEKSRAGGREIQPVVDLRRAGRTEFVAGAEPRRMPTTDLAVDSASTMKDDRPSAPIGSLVDPKGTREETTSAIAHTMPSPIGVLMASQTEPMPPAPFSSDGPVYPIAGHNAIKTGLAGNHESEAPLHTAQQAVAQVVDAPKHLPKPLEATQDFGKTNTDKPSSPSPLPVPSAPGDGSSNNWQQQVQKAIADLEQRVSPSPTTTAEVHQHVSLRMLRLLAGDTEKALEPIPHISPTEQDYWSRQLFALATYLDHHSQPDDKRRAAASVMHLDDAVANLRELGALTLRNLSFCKAVYGYGSFEPYDADVFSPGQHVSLYVEVENFKSTSSDKGYTTSLGSTYEVLDDKGKRVASGDFPDVNDCCRSRRRDFHIQFGLTLPDNVPPGRYQLQLVVKDHQCDKMGNAKASFEIRGKK